MKEDRDEAIDELIASSYAAEHVPRDVFDPKVRRSVLAVSVVRALMHMYAASVAFVIGATADLFRNDKSSHKE